MAEDNTKRNKEYDPYDCRNYQEYLSTLLNVNDNHVVVLTTVDHVHRKKEKQLRVFENDYRNK